MTIRTKRAYETPENADGFRVLVDHLWPRGVTKEKARIGRWMKEVAPSTALRKWYGHEPEKWPEFRKRYFEELRKQGAAVEELAALAKKQTVTLVFAAKDAEHCNATALREYLEQRLVPARRSGRLGRAGL